MVRTSTFILTALMGIASMTAQADDAQITPVEEFNIIPTDAIRIEVPESGQANCAAQVIWAFDLPVNSLMYHPNCEVIEAAEPFTSARNG